MANERQLTNFVRDCTLQLIQWIWWKISISWLNKIKAQTKQSQENGKQWRTRN